MNAVDLRMVLDSFEKRNLPFPLTIELDAKAFQELKHDLIVLIRDDEKAGPDNLRPNELRFMGVRVRGRLCECGAHPEDWK